MSNKDARDKGLIWSRRTEVLSLMGGKDQEWNETSQAAVVSGVKGNLELRKGKEIIEKAAIGENEASLATACTNLADTEEAQKTSRKRMKKQKPLKTSKRSRKQSVASNADSNE